VLEVAGRMSCWPPSPALGHIVLAAGATPAAGLCGRQLRKDDAVAKPAASDKPDGTSVRAA
jgi:hypothetical protein